MPDLKGSRRRLIRGVLGLALVLAILAIGPNDLITTWTGLAPGPGITLVFVLMAAVLWVT